MTKGTHSHGGRSFVWGNSLISASSNTDNINDFFYLQDHLGSPIRLIGDNNYSNDNDYSDYYNHNINLPREQNIMKFMKLSPITLMAKEDLRTLRPKDN